MLPLLALITVLGASAQEDIFLRKRVTREEATKLSAIFPGIGQISSGHKLKGTMFFVLEVASITGAFHTHETYRTKLSMFKRTRSEYMNSTSYEAAEAKWRELLELRDELDRLRRTRSAFLFSCLGVYVVSLLDAAFFTSYDVSLEPSGRGEFGVSLVIRR